MTKHQQIIGDLVASIPGTQTKGFMKAVRALCEREIPDPDDHAAITWLRLRPDAYRLNEARKIIEIYEVEVTHHLSMVKLNDYANFWWSWDNFECTDWWPELIIVNRFGQHNTYDCRLHNFPEAKAEIARLSDIEGRGSHG